MTGLYHGTPSWLTRGGYSTKLFQDGQQTLGGLGQSQQDTDGPPVVMATQGNDLFYAVGNSIRWAEMQKLKDGAELSMGSAASESGQGYRILNIRRSFSDPIQHLAVNPSGQLLAIATKYSVTVVPLPEPAEWNGDEEDPITLKRHTVGETTHVPGTSAVVKVLWHPLGLHGNCLVTVTASAVVRLWELDRRSLGSFSVPTLAIDLTKLRYAKSQEEETGSKDMRHNKAFSVDNVEMEVTSACFGSNADEAQAFEWSATTLWLTMAEGDIFALCPLLPSRFQLDDDGTITTLTELKNAQKESLDADDAFGPERSRVQAQCAWLEDLQAQFEILEEQEQTSAFSTRVYTRPKNQGVVPRLQGPFVISPDEMQVDLDPCDIHVIGASTAASLTNRDAQSDPDDEIDAGTSFSTVCILSEDGRVYICIDVDGVEPQWLPLTNKAASNDAGSSSAELLLFEVLETLSAKDKKIKRRSPKFTANSSANAYSFFVSHSNAIYRFSVDSWMHELEKEVQNLVTAGVALRTNGLVKGNGTLRERIWRPDQRTSEVPISNPVLISSEELGHFLLTSQGNQAHAVVFASPDAEEEPAAAILRPGQAASARTNLLTGPDREIYTPPPAFTQASKLGSFLENNVDPRQKRLFTEEIRLSSATLSVMNDAHRVLSQETVALNDAAADLFRRCERLHDEFKHQLEMMSEITEKVKDNKEIDAGSDQPVNRKRDIEDRLRRAQDKQTALLQKHEDLRQKLSRAGGKPLSHKERSWMAEVKKIDSSVGAEEGGDTRAADPSQRLLLQRFDDVLGIAKGMLRQAKESSGHEAESNGVTNGNDRVPPDIRRERVAQVEDMLEKETALIDAAVAKLVRLGVSGEA